MKISSISEFIKNRVSDAYSDLQMATEGLGNGCQIYPGKISSALNGIDASLRAIRDICMVLESLVNDTGKDLKENTDIKE